jgi:hypothetical protein
MIGTITGDGSWYIRGPSGSPSVPNAPTITSPAFLVSGSVGTIYPTTTFTATGPGPITWSITSGALPSGLTFSSSGVLSGTPASSAFGNIQFTATNSYGNTRVTLALTVNSASIEPNVMTLSLPTGSATNYPYQFGRVFKQGVIANSPQVLIDGVAQTTQADVKNRWPDGSVKFAVISLVVPSLGTSIKNLTFQNQASPNNTPETKANMLANYDFDCVVNATQNLPITSSVTFTVSGQNIPLTDATGATIAKPIGFENNNGHYSIVISDRDGNVLCGDLKNDGGSSCYGIDSYDNIVNSVGTPYAHVTVTGANTASPSFTISQLQPAVHKIQMVFSIGRNDGSNASATGYAGQKTSVTVVRTGYISSPYSYPLVGYLTKEQPLIACASDGTFSSLTAASGQFKLFKNNVDVTSSATYSVVSQTNCTVSIGASTGAYTVNTLTADSGTAVLSAVYNGETINLTLIVNKSKAGTNTPSATNAPVFTVTSTTDNVFRYDSSNGQALTGAPISARTILNSLSDATLANNTTSASPNSRYWTSGPLCTTVILADHTNKAYDFGTNSSKSLRPTFHVQFWPTLNRYRVRVVVESGDVTKLQDQFYDAYITTGYASPLTRYSRTAIPQHLSSRWTKSFWSGTVPATLNVNHNASYLADTRSIPYYDPLNVPTEAQMQADITSWNTKSKDIYDNGSDTWTRYMQSPGGRAEIALFPDWTISALQTGDYRKQTISDNLAEMALAWPMHFREGDSTKTYFAPGSNCQGFPATVNARPTVFLINGNAYMAGFPGSGTTSTDRFTFVPPANSPSDPGGSSSNSNTWSPFWDHCPDPFTVPYITTGEYLWYEQLMFWASHGVFDSSYDPTNAFYSRGPVPTSGGVGGDIRRQAWVWRIRVSAANWSIDSSREKDYFTYLVKSGITVNEGIRKISPRTFTDTQFDADYAWGQTIGRIGFYGTPLNGVDVDPLHYGDHAGGYAYGYNNYTGYLSSTYGSVTVGAEAATFQQAYFLLSMAYAKDLGFATDNLISWYSYYFTEANKDPATAWIPASNPAPLQRGAIRDSNQNNGNLVRNSWFNSWQDVLSVYNTQTYIPGLKPTDSNFQTVLATGSPQALALSTWESHGSSPNVGAAAFSILNDQGQLPGANTTWTWYKTNFNDVRLGPEAFGGTYFPFQPGWAMTARPVVTSYPRILTTTLTNATALQPYNFQLKALGAPNAFTWTLTSGNKPAWMTISSGGTISGTPLLTDVNTGINLTFNCSNGNAPDANATFSFAVQSIRPVINIANISTPYFDTNKAWNVNGGDWWDATGTANGTTPWATITDPSEATLFTVDITSLMQAIYDNPYKLSAIIICGSGPAPGSSWALSEDTDSTHRPRVSYDGGADQYVISDTGLNLSGFGGAPTSASWNVYGDLGSGSSSGGRIILNLPVPLTRPTSATLKIYKLRQYSGPVTNSIFWLRYPGESVPTSYPIILSPTYLTDGSTGTAYANTQFIAAGVPPITWSILSGTLPSGMTFSSSGLLSGTPTLNTTSSQITFKASNSSGNANTTLALTVNASGPVLVTPPSISAFSGVATTAGSLLTVTPAVWQNQLPYELTGTISTVNATSAYLGSSASSVPNYYAGMWLVIITGTTQADNFSQTSAIIQSYDSGTKTATITQWGDPVNLVATPTAGQTFKIIKSFPVDRKWQWLRNGSPIANQTSGSYTTQVADIGASISVSEIAGFISDSNTGLISENPSVTTTATSSAVAVSGSTNSRLVYGDEISYLGSFALPGAGTGYQSLPYFAAGGLFIKDTSGTKTLVVRGHINASAAAEFSIPTSLGTTGSYASLPTASIIYPASTSTALPLLSSGITIDPNTNGDSNFTALATPQQISPTKMLFNYTAWGGHGIGIHYRRPLDLSDQVGANVEGPFCIADPTYQTNSKWAGNWYCPIPSSWQSALGGDFLAGQGNPRMSYSSYTDWSQGPSAMSFNTANIDTALTRKNSGNCQSTNSTTTIQLATSANGTNDYYKNHCIAVTGFASRTITAYNGTTKIATVDQAWPSAPAAGTSYFTIPLVSGRQLVGRSTSYPLQASYNGYGTHMPVWNFSTVIGGMCIPDNTDSLLMFSRTGDNIYTYSQPEISGASGQQNAGIKIYDPSNPDPGPHTGSSFLKVYAYDLNDLAAVYANTKSFNEIKPYGLFKLTLPASLDSSYRRVMTGVTYDSSANKIYVSESTGASKSPTIHVFQLTHNTGPTLISAPSINVWRAA